MNHFFKIDTVYPPALKEGTYLLVSMKSSIYYLSACTNSLALLNPFTQSLSKIYKIYPNWLLQ